MKEVTRITLVQVTEVLEVSNDQAVDEMVAKSKSEEFKRSASDRVKEVLNVDDAEVLKIQNFVRDI